VSRLSAWIARRSARIAALEKKTGQALNTAPGSGHIVRLPVPAGVKLPEQDHYSLLMRHLPQQ
jgi:putative protease